jgi:hypothetical protein
VTEFELRAASVKLTDWSQGLQKVAPAFVSARRDGAQLRQVIADAGIPFSRVLLAEPLGLVHVFRAAAIDHDLSQSFAMADEPRRG